MKHLVLALITVVWAATLQAQTYPEMILVEGGTFTMGDEHGEGDSDEQPLHEVTLKTYKISKTPVTVAQYRAYCRATGRSMPDPPSWGWIDSHPMVYVTWHDAVAYTDWLAEKMDADYRLPTEAEWEYAARGGNQSRGYTYSGGNDLETVAWFVDNAGGQTQRVGRKKPNELGIYDMSGNVWEWCRDWYGSDYYANSSASNPKGPSSGLFRVIRGGSWYTDASNCRVADRDGRVSSTRAGSGGFRVVLSQ